MFESLSSRLTAVFDKLTGRGALSENDVNEAVREVRRALLEADVSLDVVRSFTDKVKERAVGAAVIRSGAASTSGVSRRKVEPSPTTLRTVRPPPSNWARRRLIDRPRPVPPNSRVTPVEPCSKLSNTRRTAAAYHLRDHSRREVGGCRFRQHQGFQHALRGLRGGQAVVE